MMQFPQCFKLIRYNLNCFVIIICVFNYSVSNPKSCIIINTFFNIWFQQSFEIPKYWVFKINLYFCLISTLYLFDPRFLLNNLSSENFTLSNISNNVFCPKLLSFLIINYDLMSARFHKTSINKYLSLSII